MEQLFDSHFFILLSLFLSVKKGGNISSLILDPDEIKASTMHSFLRFSSQGKPLSFLSLCLYLSPKRNLDQCGILGGHSFGGS